MSRLFAICVILLLLLLLMLPLPKVHGCAIAPRRGGHIDITSENALIVYDSAAKMEHFIRTATFRTSTSADFGFLVPTPSKPELEESSPNVFRELAEITKPRTVKERRVRQPDIGCGLMPMSKQATTNGAAPLASVNVVERKRVGVFDAVVLKADDPKKLREWLADNGFEARPQLEKWFEVYTANHWYLTAFKIAHETDGATPPGGPKMVHNSAVRISFPTDTPFYPYREPEESGVAQPGASRLLRVFVLSDSRVTGTLGRGPDAQPWVGSSEAYRLSPSVVWANKVDAGRLARLTPVGHLPESIGKRDWYLTEFEDHSSPRRGTDEVYFSASADQSTVERTPLIEYEYYDPPVWPWVSAAIGAPVLVLIAGLLVWRLLWRKG